MYFIIFLLLFALLFIALFIVIPVKISFLLDTDRIKMQVRFMWLYPLVEIKASMLNYSPHVTVYLLRKKVFSKSMKITKKQKSGVYRYFDYSYLKDTEINAQYALGNPFNTAMANILIQLTKQFLKGSFCSEPDYMSDHAYIFLQASTRFNIGKSVANSLIKHSI